jgi:hypothetical protein
MANDIYQFQYRKFSRKKHDACRTHLTSNLDAMQKEDLQDQLFLVKNQLNTANLELTRVKTRFQILQDHMKGKDRFIDEMLRHASRVHNVQGYNSQTNDGGYSSAGENFEKMVNKSPYNALKLKKKLNDCKEMLAYRTAENDELRRNVKNLKVIQLQKMLKIQDKNIMRLKHIAQKAINMVKGQGDKDDH